MKTVIEFVIEPMRNYIEDIQESFDILRASSGLEAGLRRKVQLKSAWSVNAYRIFGEQCKLNPRHIGTNEFCDELAMALQAA